MDNAFLQASAPLLLGLQGQRQDLGPQRWRASEGVIREHIMLRSLCWKDPFDSTGGRLSQG